MVAEPPRALDFSRGNFTRRVPADVRASRNVLRYHRSRHYCATHAQRYAGKDDRPRADANPLFQRGIEIETARHIVGKDDCVRTNHATGPNMHATRPGAIDQSRRVDPRVRRDVHAPQETPHRSLPKLAERAAPPPIGKSIRAHQRTLTVAAVERQLARLAGRRA